MLASWRYGVVLAIIVALYLLPIPFSIMNFDLARDVAIAFSVASGDTWPMEGPMFAGAIHAGPLWYYLFAIPFVFVPSVLPALLWIGALAALKIPLAYMIGARFVDRPTGLLWAMLLILPGWETFESITVLHPSLVATCTLAFLWLVLSYVRDGRPAHLVASGLALAIAFHAHPSTFGLAFLLLAAIIFGHQQKKLPWTTYAWLALATIAPFLPYLVFQAYTGFPDWYGGANYLTNGRNLGDARSVPGDFFGLFATGPVTVADGFASGITGMTWMMFGAYGFVYCAAAAGLAISLVNGRRRLVVAGTLTVFLVLLIAVALIRADTPYHMTYVLWVFASGLIALGLRAWFDFRAWRLVALLAMTFAGIWTITMQANVAISLERGAYRFALLPLFDIKQPRQHGAPMPFVPAYALAANGERLCAAPDVVAHGVLAVHLLHDYAIEARLACGDTSHVYLGGKGAPDSTHWAGISRVIVDTLNLPMRVWIGPVGVTSIVQVIQPAAGTRVPTLQQYPPATDRNEPEVRNTVEFDAASDEIVLVTNTYFTFSPGPRVEATANGVPVPVAARDQASLAYACTSCADGVRWRLDITAPELDRVDIVTIKPQK